MSYSQEHLNESIQITSGINPDTIETIVRLLKEIKDAKGRIFFLGVGGSAANAGHAVNDFRKLAGIESYAPTDNVAELTARTNDEGWETVFSGWLKVSNLNSNDCLFILSVGGGDKERNISTNLCEAIDYGKSVGAKITGIVGRDGGYTAKNADVCLVIPTVNSATVTPHSESFQVVIWHLLVSHPDLKSNPTKW
jgi:D-sedoheptulose 7-phosphate isomerase